VECGRSTHASGVGTPVLRRSGKERRRGVAPRAPRPKAVVRGGETQYGLATSFRPTKQGWRPVGARLGRHGADHASRGAPVVGPPSRSYCYGKELRLGSGGAPAGGGSALLTRLAPLLQQASKACDQSDSDSSLAVDASLRKYAVNARYSRLSMSMIASAI